MVATATQPDVGRTQDEPPGTGEARPFDTHCTQAPPRGVRHRLPAERASLTHHFTIGQHDGYLTVGLFPNGEPGEIFVTIAKQGSTLGGLMDSFAKAISVGLQFGVPLRLFCAKFSHTRFEPSGWTGNPEMGFASSIMDYIFRWLQQRFVDGHSAPTHQSDRVFVTQHGAASIAAPSSHAVHMNGAKDQQHAVAALGGIVDLGDAPACNICGSICLRNGACFKCPNCGQTTGCG